MHSIGGPELQYSLSLASAEIGNSAATINHAAYFMTGLTAPCWRSIIDAQVVLIPKHDALQGGRSGLAGDAVRGAAAA
jgi:hypothetical protein